MKIIFAPLSYKFQNIYLAARSVLGSDFYHWSVGNKSIYDLIDETKAAYIFCEERHLTDELYSVVKNTGIRLVLFGVGVPSLIEEMDQPSLLCCPSDITSNIKKQLEYLKTKVILLRDCANIVYLNDVKMDISSEVGFISASSPNEYPHYQTMVNALRKLGLSKFQLKVLGSQNLPLPEFLGEVRPDEFTGFYKSSDINLDFDGKSILDIAISNAFCISNVQNKLYPYYADEDEMMSMIESFLNKPSARKSIAKKAFNSIIEVDTSFHRLIEIFTALNKPKLVHLSQCKLKEVTNEIRDND